MIEVANLTKRFGSTCAVDDLTFQVEPGAVTGFLGPNGAGKSTTMRMIVGLDHPTEGTATINGVPYSGLERPLHTVGALLEARATHPNRSAANHLRWIAAAGGVPRSRVDEVLGLVGLSDVAGRRTGGFSLGMHQRLGLAAALLGDPEVLLLDEPVNGLDPEGIRWVRGLMQALAAEGRTVLVSSHLLSEMAQTAERLIVIGRGRLIADTTTHEFISGHSATTTLVRSPRLAELTAALEARGMEVVHGRDPEGRERLEIADRTPDEIGALAFEAGVPLAELAERRASLEDAFMETTGHAVEYHAAAPGLSAQNGPVQNGPVQNGPTQNGKADR